MKEESKMYNNNIHPLPINISIKNEKIVESFSPNINFMNRTTSESLYNKKDMTSASKTTYKRINKLIRTKKKINYSKSTNELNKKKNLRYSYKRLTKNEKSNNINYKNSSVENEKVSAKIFNDLDKIQEAILEDYKISMPINEKKENNKDQNNDFKNLEKQNNDKLNSNNYNNPINIKDNKYLTVPIKSRTSENFFPINRSHNKEFSPSNNLNMIYTHHKRLKSTEETKPQHITRYLDRKKINDLPVTFPLYLSYNNKYNSISEKNRVDKILSKLICLKTHLLKDPLNRIEIIKEFFLKNGFKKNIYYKDDSISNFYYYLKQPFSFPPEFSLSDVINEGIKYKYNKEKDDDAEMEINNFLDYLPKNRKWSDYITYSKKKIKNSPSENEIIYNLLMEEIYKKRYINYDSFKNKTLPVLIKDLEKELREIKIEKMEKLEKYNSLIASRKLQTIKLTDNNKYVPNLCLISKGFKERCKAVIDKKNRKIIKNMNKQEHLKQINNRLYYDNIRKNNLIEFDRNDIQRRLKLTEFVVMERAKKQLKYMNAKNKFKSSLERIRKKE